MDKKNANQIRQTVRRRYAQVARRASSDACCGEQPPSAEREARDCCAPPSETCCGDSLPRRDSTARRVEAECCSDASSSGCVEGDIPVKQAAQRLGYSPEELRQVPSGAYMGLGCGNPQAIAELQSGETVLDLGSGGGLDCFLAARQVGETGSVIGVDMTPEMVSRAREHAREGDYKNIEFRLGEIEHLPVADDSVDVIISNCVINLSPDKPVVFREAYRVLRPGGRLAISDIVATAPLPAEIRSDSTLWSCCVGGAETIQDLESWLRETGFKSICIHPQDESREFIREWAPGRSVDEYIVSATIEAIKPAS